jgi:hypothetical protein
VHSNPTVKIIFSASCFLKILNRQFFLRSLAKILYHSIDPRSQFKHSLMANGQRWTVVLDIIVPDGHRWWLMDLWTTVAIVDGHQEKWGTMYLRLWAITGCLNWPQAPIGPTLCRRRNSRLLWRHRPLQQWPRRRHPVSSDNGVHRSKARSGEVSGSSLGRPVYTKHVPIARHDKGCQIFLDTIYQSGGKYNKLPLNKAEDHKVYEIDIKDFPKLGGLV